MSKSFLFVLYMFSVVPSAHSWTIVDKNGDIAIINGPVRHDYDIGSLCLDIKYPGTEKYIPIWLSEQLNHIAQENIEVPLSRQTRTALTIWRGRKIYLNTKEDCVPKADQYVDMLRRAVEENQKYADNPEYQVFNIDEFVNHVRKYEQLP